MPRIANWNSFWYRRYNLNVSCAKSSLYKNNEFSYIINFEVQDGTLSIPLGINTYSLGLKLQVCFELYIKIPYGFWDIISMFLGKKSFFFCKYWVFIFQLFVDVGWHYFQFPCSSLIFSWPIALIVSKRDNRNSTRFRRYILNGLNAK